ncbi:unnamed protein product [Rhizophagus irregularis]|uniref:Protein kinase domain-containing protein n=1 Tax=Rhizophagus irregularis TaxID=588596 RepID=A0A915ZMG6_9GLOM|nr:unnamed protein product [Rhizophagus irregularis]
MQVNTSNLNKREFKRIGSRNIAKVCRLKKVVEEKIEVNSGKNNIHFYGNIREYADCGALSAELIWKDKINMAIQLFHVVLSIHNEGIAHHDLRFNIMMLIQKNIKLANLGLHLNKNAFTWRIVETTVPNIPKDYVKIYTESTNSCYTAKDNVDERRYLANDSIPELQPGRNVN